MANYTSTDLVNAQARFLGKFDNNDLNYRTPSVLLQFLRNTAIMLLSYESLRTREDRAIEVSYRTRTSRALGSARAHNHAGAHGDSATLTPTWTTYSDPFSISLKQADNNTLSLGEMLANEMENSMINFAEGLETVATAYAFNNRSGVNVSTQEGTFDAVDDAFEITESTNGDRAVQITMSSMKDNKYSGNMTFFCDNVSYNKFLYQANQGSGNATNLSFQFNGINFVNAVELGALGAGLVSAYSKGFWIAVPDGTISALPWIPKQNRMGVETRLSSYGTVFNPILGLDMALHSYEALADGTATNGYTQDVYDRLELSVDMSFNHAQSTTANKTPMMAFALV